SVSGVDSADFTLVTSGVSGASITGVTGSGTSRTVTASTGIGDGTIGLTLVDDDSIVDTAGHPLGGTGAGNGNFTGPFYTIDKTPPTVSSINRASASLTNASSVQFSVTFSESVTAVTTGEFTLVTTGVSSASISSVNGSGTAYTVTVSTGSGTGTIGLNLTDDDSIIDSASNPLGGAGSGNGNFTGQVYTIDKTAPTAAITYSPTGSVKAGTSLTITATFSEPMADSPVVQFSISGANTMAATNMTKVSSTQYTGTHVVGAGDGTATVALSTGTDVPGNVITAAPTSGAT